MFASRVLPLAALIAITATAVNAGSAPCPPPPPPQTPPCPTISKVVAAPFQLKQIATKKISDCVSRSQYKGETVLTITSCDGTTVDVPVILDLSSTTTLNACGDGATEGDLKITAKSGGRPALSRLSAVNTGFGYLNGTIEGQLALSAPSGNHPEPPLDLYAIFTGEFVKDANGNYTIVQSTARGVVANPTNQQH